MINTWWSDDPSERLWMETVRRPEHGDAISAPLTKLDGHSWPYYELVQHVQDGDVVLHWDTAREGGPSAFVGASRVDGAPYPIDDMTFHDSSPTTGYEALLTDYVPVDPPLTLGELNERFDAIVDARDAAQEHAGKHSPYFPFNIRQDGTVRAMQGGYLTKFPRGLLAVLPELAAAVDSLDGAATHVDGSDTARAAGGSSRTDRRHSREAGHITDALVRKAIEERAVLLATTFYRGAGYEVEDVGATRSYDLVVIHSGTGEERHVEVKGSSGGAESVELTNGEVEHARTYQPTDLFVVSGISWWREGTAVLADGGTATRFPDWAPDRDSLTPTRFRYVVPEDGSPISDEAPG